MPSIIQNPGRIGLALTLFVMSAGTLGGMAVAGQGDGPASCELRVSRPGGTIALTALAHAEEKLSGSYTLKVSGRGTNIRQSGPFRAAPGQPATLGTVTLSTDGSSYDADLDIIVDGVTQSCSKRISGGI